MSSKSDKEGGVVKKEESEEKAGMHLNLPFHEVISRPKPPLLERPHAILPDAWLDIENSKIVKDDVASSRICFGMVCRAANVSTSVYGLQG